MQAMLIAFHPEESSFLSFLLKQAGFEVHVSKYLKPAVENWPEQPIDLLCLVLENDSEQIINAIKQLRGHTVVPMIAITEPLTEDSEVTLLEAGVDLIVPRPYGLRLLSAKIKALMRRTAGVPYHNLPVLSRGPIVLDPSQRTVTVEERDMAHLTQLEFRLLYVLLTHAGQIIPTENIVEHVWGYSGEGNRELVRGLVQRLRSKVELDKTNPKYILTEKGLGYYLKIDE
jgi:DNA-binding response OmpR family regulator